MFRGRSKSQRAKREKRAPIHDEIGLKKTNRFLILIVLVAFLILNAVYFLILRDSTNKERLRIMEGAADQLTQRFDELASTNMGLREGNRILQGEMQELAQLTKAKIWIVRNNGEIIYATEIPASLLKAYPRSTLSGKVVLPDKYSGANFPESGLTMQGGTFMGLFEEEGGSWLSVAKPLYNHNAVQVATVQLHENIDTKAYLETYLVNGILVTFIVGLFVALLFIEVINQQISYPLTELAHTAEQVSLGDLSARVELPEYFTNENGRLLPTSSLGSLMDTFNAMVEHLENDAREQRDFIAAITHDLRTPLTSILGFVTGMLDGTIPPELHERYLGIVQQEAVHMRSLVQEMTLAGMMDESKGFDFQDFKLQDLLDDVIEAMEPQLNEKHLTLQTDFAKNASDKPVMVTGDREALTRVLTNLLNNAVKFTPEEGVIAVITKIHHQGPRVVEVRVEDSGPGIAPEEAHQVFDRFYKSDRSRTGKAGSGLGLFIVKSILQEHGQHIRVERSSMGGAAFVFTLPLA